MSQAISFNSETPAPAAGRQWLMSALSALLLVLLCINFIRPPTLATDASHDRGSHMAFEWYAVHHYQFGVDVIQNVGPLGYLQYPADYSGLLPGRKLIFSISLAILLGVMSHRALRYFQTPEKVIWILCLFLMPYAPQGEIDSMLYLLILLSAHHLVMRRTYGNAWLLSAIVWIFLAVLCLMKITNLAIAGFLLSITTACNLIERRYWRILFDSVCFVVPLVLIWGLAGQHLGNFLPFLRDTVAFTSGYNEAMIFTIDDDNILIVMAVSVLALFVVLNAFRLRHPSRNRTRLLLALFEAGCLFIIWKHAYVRADWVHIAYFWCFMLAAAPLIFVAHPNPPSAENVSESSRGWRMLIDWMTPRRMSLIALGAVLYLSFYVSEVAGFPSDWPWKQVTTNTRLALHWREQLASLQNDLRYNIKENALPDLEQLVGQGTIDEFGYLPGIILLNHLNYHPRPMAINFAAYNQAIQQRNAEFYRNPQTAPKFILLQPGMMDQVFDTQDDSLAVLQILAHYRLVVEGGRHKLALLQRLQDKEPVADLQPMASHTIHPGEWLDVPNVAWVGTWCTVRIKPNLWGAVRSFFFRPSMVAIVLQANHGREMPLRFLTGEGPTGFLLAPIIMNQPDWLVTYSAPVDPNLYHAAITKIKFVYADPSCWADDIQVNYWGLTFHQPTTQP